jgi:hypothetical protein
MSMPSLTTGSRGALKAHKGELDENGSPFVMRNGRMAKRENQITRWTRAKKEALIVGDPMRNPGLIVRALPATLGMRAICIWK